MNIITTPMAAAILIEAGYIGCFDLANGPDFSRCTVIRRKPSMAGKSEAVVDTVRIERYWHGLTVMDLKPRAMGGSTATAELCAIPQHRWHGRSLFDMMPRRDQRADMLNRLLGLRLQSAPNVQTPAA